MTARNTRGSAPLAVVLLLTLAAVPVALAELPAPHAPWLETLGGRLAAGGATHVPSPPADSDTTVYPAGRVDVPPRFTPAAAAAVRDAMNALYPRMLRDAGISARTVVRFIVETDGSVDPGTVTIVSSTDPQFTAPSEKLPAAARFTPGRKAGHAVRTLVEMPLAWTAAPSPELVGTGPAGP